MPLKMNSGETGAAQKSKSGNPYGGIPLHVPAGLENRIRESFGINARELNFRESPEVAEMGTRATAQGNAIRFAPVQGIFGFGKWRKKKAKRDKKRAIRHKPADDQQPLRPRFG